MMGSKIEGQSTGFLAGGNGMIRSILISGILGFVMHTSYQNWHVNLATDGIMWLSLDKAQASTNTLNEAIFQEFEQVLDEIHNQAGIKALILTSYKSTGFIAGADIEQFSQLASEEAAYALIRRGQALYDRLAALPIPTVALIDGFCLGGGLELALACRYRVAEDSAHTRFGLPEVLLGIHPGWGGSVRLPALIGAINAMDLILSGRTVTAKAAKALGLVDAAVPRRQLKTAAQYYALQQPKPHRPTWWQRQSNAPWLRPLLAKLLTRKLQRKIHADHYPAPFAVVDYWRQFGVSQAAYQAEAKSLAKLHSHPHSQNGVRVFFLQNTLKSLAKHQVTPIRHVHVVGAGTMGGDIAAWCALQGLYVTLQDQSPQAVAPAIKRAAALFGSKLKSALLIQAALDRLQVDLEGYGVKTADVIIEAIVENAAAKQQLFQRLEQQAKATALLATNTSSIPLQEIAQTMQAPERLVGIHFFNPVAKMRLVEVVQGQKTQTEAFDQALAFVRKIDKLPLPVQDSPGFLVNRVLMPYLLECMALLQEGYGPEMIDAAAVRFGMPMGPVELADTVGLDICLSVAQNLSRHFGGEVPAKLNALVAAKQLGRKTGQGFYRYHHHQAVKAPVTLTEDAYQKIHTRLVYRLLNEAVACLREGVVAQADWLDAGLIFGTGFAPFTGGPLHYAKQLGQQTVLESCQQLMLTYGLRFKPDSYWPSFFETETAAATR